MPAAPLAAALLCLPAAPPPGLAAGPPAAPDLPPGVLAYEPFDQVGGRPVLGTAGGVGWAGPWVPDPLYPDSPDRFAHPRRWDHLRGAAASLRYPGVAAAGGAAAAAALNPQIGAVSRRLAAPVGLPGTTTYVGVLIRPDGRLLEGALEGGFGVMLDLEEPDARMRSGAYNQRRILQGGPTGHFDLSFGKPWSEVWSRSREWCLWTPHQNLGAGSPLRAFGRPLTLPPGVSRLPIQLGGGWAHGNAQFPVGQRTELGETVFLVLRVEVAADGRRARFSLMMNPDPAEPDPPPGAAILYMPTDPPRPGRYSVWLTLFSSGAVTFDELRVATTLAGAAGRDLAKEAEEDIGRDD